MCNASLFMLSKNPGNLFILFILLVLCSDILRDVHEYVLDSCVA